MTLLLTSILSPGLAGFLNLCRNMICHFSKAVFFFCGYEKMTTSKICAVSAVSRGGTCGCGLTLREVQRVW